MKKTNAFLKDVLLDLQAEKEPISKLTFIVPSKRAGIFLKRYLIEIYGDLTFICPKILSTEEFIEQLCGLVTIDNTQTLFEFYETYLQLFPELEKEDFDSFMTWGQTLIHDFNEIDRYCIDHNSIFTYLTRITELKHWYVQKDKTALVKNYIAFWDKLLDYYKAFKARLLQKGIAYQGLCYRIASEKINEYIKTTTTKHILVGFNALNTAEQIIFQTLLDNDLGKIYWDTDAFFMDSAYHDASLFLKKYSNDWQYFKNKPFKWVNESFSDTKNIQLLGTPKNVSQAIIAGQILKKIPKAELSNTALVLADESLLSPVLSFLPDTISNVNITMGLPIKELPVNPFFETLFTLHKKQKGDTFYFQEVLELLALPTTQKLLGSDATLIAKAINQQNIIYVKLADIEAKVKKSTQDDLRLLFTPWKNVSKAINTCQNLIGSLKERYQEENNTLILEYLFHFNSLFNKIASIHTSYKRLNSIQGLYHVYRDLISQENLDFIGEPYQGLQLMGMLESRCLDFDTVIITSMNEGILPAGKSNNSFIPYDLKRTYELPTYKEKDAIYTYHFYRLMHRAKNIYLIYNTENEGVGGGEKSRFLRQLEIDKRPNHTIQKYIVSAPTENTPKKLTQIEKNSATISSLDTLAEKGFSPSALTNYIRNPIDFYYQYILKIREIDEVEETVALNTLGTIIHNVLEEYYKPYEGKELLVAHIDLMQRNLDKAVRYQFDKEYPALSYEKGKNRLIFEVAKRYIQNFLSYEKRSIEEGNTLKIIAVEAELKAPLYIEELNKTVFLRGKVDRIDNYNGQLRVIDYKTGNVQKGDVNVLNWEPLVSDYKYSKIIQVLAYAYMFNQNAQIKEPFEAGIISFRNLKTGFLKFGVKKSPRDASPNTTITEEVFKSYLVEIKKLILELYDTSIPFTEKEV
ncbi:PD-(D/E)XK nuclease family protein [Aquimarina brevivitae]|uniref:PD-(D/E)XK nuclease superfamily protein n=1 Tax=Aquimarina brevivitae TaxID=323412 RepID=A0A4Q7PHU6_9FLAO|nr:PD-(D/E)XK nuclease family protein [Aquimarina brevivitae]RZS99528.1 PD-(D/E)XK nuclease superfamily protein [Aquimarina brevivitae]